MWRYIVPGGVFVVLAGFFLVGLWREPGRIPSPLIGKPAPTFELERVEDPTRTVSNRDFAGRMYLVNVWATWCVGCRQEHEALLEIARRDVVPILGLNWNDDRQQALRWLGELGDPYVASAYDGDGRVAIDWGVYGAPETFLVDADGTVLHKHFAPLTLAHWEQDFMPLIRARQGAAGQ